MRFARQGQSCTAGSRLFLHETIWDEVMPRLVARVQALKVGDALDESTDIGAVINAERYGAVRSFIAEAVAAGARVEGGVGAARSRGGQRLLPVAGHLQRRGQQLADRP